MSLANPMNIAGPSWPGNYQQPNTATPAPNPNIASFPTGANTMGVTWPLQPYVQPGPR